MTAKPLTAYPAHPAEILHRAESLSRKQCIWTSDMIPEWVQAGEYLSWAQAGLVQNDAFGHDAAVCYAKRAICRLIDSFLVHNHLGRWKDSLSNPQKIELLGKVGIIIPDIAHDLIIDPRNDIEHGYSRATPEQARHAVQLAELLLKSLESESQWAAIISLGLNYGPMIGSADNDGESWRWCYSHNPRGEMLVVDAFSSDQRALFIDHANEEVRYARLADFTKEQVIELARQLRGQRSNGGYFAIGCPPHIFTEFKRRLGITN